MMCFFWWRHTYVITYFELNILSTQCASAERDGNLADLPRLANKCAPTHRQDSCCSVALGGPFSFFYMNNDQK